MPHHISNLGFQSSLSRRCTTCSSIYLLLLLYFAWKSSTGKFAHLISTSTPHSFAIYIRDTELEQLSRPALDLQFLTTLILSNTTTPRYKPRISELFVCLCDSNRNVLIQCLPDPESPLLTTRCANTRKTTISIPPAKIPGLTSLVLRSTANESVDVQEVLMNGTSWYLNIVLSAADDFSTFPKNTSRPMGTAALGLLHNSTFRTSIA